MDGKLGTYWRVHETTPGHEHVTSVVFGVGAPITMSDQQPGAPGPPIVVGDLGPIQIEGRRLEGIVRSPAQRSIFVALILSQEGGIRSDRLVEFVWPSQEPNRRRLWDAVHRLRAALAAGGIDVVPVNIGGRYRLDRPVLLESDRFRELLAAARSVSGTNPRHACDLLDTARQLWRGEAYDGHDLETLMPGVVQSLAESRLAAERARARMVLAIDGPEAVISDLEALASDSPFDEGVVELLIVALRDAGRRVDALRRLRRFKTQLADSTGIEPGTRLAALEGELLSIAFTDEELVARTGPRPVRHWRTSFIGRRRDTERLEGLITSNRLVSIVGPGGVGKTRLAVELASGEDSSTEPTIVDLTATADPASIDAVMTTALGLNETTSRAVLCQHLERFPRLVVLDNCEHLIHAAAHLVSDLLTGTTSTRFVATSRLPLRIAGEQVLKLVPLDTTQIGSGSEAARLFCDRSGLDYAKLPASDRQLIDEVVERLDGLPLGIELAAARSDALGLDGLASGLDDRFELLGTGDRSKHQRHRSLEAMLAWSTNLLDDHARTVLASCAIFVGSFSLSDTVAVASDEATTGGTVRRAIADLVDANLVERDRQTNPYRCLETIRHFGRDRLLGPAGVHERSQRHAHHFAAKAVSLASDSYGPGEAVVLNELVGQADEYRAAIKHLSTEQDWQVLADLVWGASTVAFSLRGAWPEPVFLVADLVDRSPVPPPPRWAALLSVVASTLHRRDLPDVAARLAASAIEIDPESHLPWLHTGVALAPIDAESALRHVDRAVQISDPNRPDELLHSLWGLTNVRRRTGDVEGALQAATDLVVESRRFETERGESIGLVQLAYLAPNGSPQGAEAARRAFELSLVSCTPVAEKTAAMLHIQHLLHQDPSAADLPLLMYLQRPVVHTPFGPSVVAAAAAYFAMTGETRLATELAQAIGQNQLVDFVDLEPVGRLLQGVPHQVDPMSIARQSLETMTSRAIDHLQDHWI